MSTIAAAPGHAAVHHAVHPVQVHVVPATRDRNRLTVAFRPILALPHLLLVGGPLAAVFTWTWRDGRGVEYNTGAGGVFGAVAFIVVVIAWFAILFTGAYPAALHRFGVGVLRWTVRVEAYLLLLHDAYPPFTLAA
jgi:hypothetical protein